MSDIDADVPNDGTSVRSLADNTRLIWDVSNCSKFQEDLLKIYDWADTNMWFNSLKFDCVKLLMMCSSHVLVTYPVNEQ